MWNTYGRESETTGWFPMKKSCQDLEKNLGKIFSRSCKNLARNQAIQDFRMDFEQESCKIRKILASSKSWHGFGTDFLPTCQILKRLGKILQDFFDRVLMVYHGGVVHAKPQNQFVKEAFSPNPN